MINYLSLDKIIEALKLRNEEIKKLLSKKSIFGLEEVLFILNKPLVFPKRLSKDLIDHSMPEIPSTSIRESIKFLIQKLDNEKLYLEKK